MKRKNGFTLIELLAVIVILAVIALIATPLIMNTINDSKESALKNSVRNIINIAELEYMERLVSNENEVPEITFDELEWKGQKVDMGKITFDESGKASIAVSQGNLCVYRMSTDNDVILERGLTAEECMKKFPAPLGSDGCELIDVVNEVERTKCNTFTWDGDISGLTTVDGLYITSTNIWHKYAKLSDEVIDFSDYVGTKALVEIGNANGDIAYVEGSIINDYNGIGIQTIVFSDFYSGGQYKLDTESNVHYNIPSSGTWIHYAGNLTLSFDDGNSYEYYVRAITIPGFNWNESF